MKKIAAIALSLLMMLTVFAGCKSKGNEELASAKDYLTNMYQTAGKDEVMTMLMDKDVLSVVTIDGVEYSVEWTVEVTKGDKDAIKIGKSYEENHVLIDVPGLPERDIFFTATATIKDEKGNTETVEFKYKVAGRISDDDDEAESSAIAENETSSEAAESEDDNTNTSSTNKPGTNSTSSTNKPSTNGTSSNKPASTNTSSQKPGGSTTAPSDPKAIVDAAYALEKDTSLDYTATLTGKVISVNEAYNAEYKNITVTIQVEGRENKPIKCYRLTGTDVEKIGKGDTITVTGVLKNHYGTIEFDLGCTLDKRVAAQSAVKEETDPKKIVEAAYKLANGEDLGYPVTLTGKVISISEPYNSEYGNITVLMVVEGKELTCYRMKGNNLDKIAEGDTITVTGTIKNFNGTIEFDTGCTLRERVAGTGTQNKTLKVVDSPKAGVAYKFGMIQGNVSDKTVYYLAGGMAQTYYLKTASSSAIAIDVYLENTNGGYYLYTTADGKKQYINMVVNGTHVNGKYADEAATVYTFDATSKTIVANVTVEGETAPYWFGTRNDKNYTTVGPCKTEYEGFYCKFYQE